MSSTQKPTCFVIAPIGEKDSDVRKHSDKVLKYIIRRALSDKYEISRADEITEPGMITSQVLQAVQDSALVVADLTGHNPNVFCELAVRHAIEKPVIRLIDRSLSKIPFDVGGFRAIEFALTDIDSVEGPVEQLKKQTESGKWGETPLKIAQVMRPAKEDSPELLLLKQAVEGISDIAARITKLEPNPVAPSHDRFVKLSTLAGPDPASDWIRASDSTYRDAVKHLAEALDGEIRKPRGRGKAREAMVREQEKPEKVSPKSDRS